MKVRSLALAAVAVLAILMAALLRDDPEPTHGSLLGAELGKEDVNSSLSLESDEDWNRSAVQLPKPGAVSNLEFIGGSGTPILEGRVSDRAGMGIAEATILLVTDLPPTLIEPEERVESYPFSRSQGIDEILVRTETDAAGKWRIEISPSLQAQLSSSEDVGVLAEAAGYKDGGQPLDDEVLRQGGRCEIVLALGATMRGRVLTPQHEVAPRSYVYGSRAFPGSIEASGEFRMEVAPDVEFDLLALDASGTYVRTDLVVPLGTELDVGDLVLIGPGTIAGRVLLPDGTPAPHLAVKVLQDGSKPHGSPPRRDRAGGNHSAMAVTDEYGVFRIGGLRDGDFRVYAQVNRTELQMTARGFDVGVDYSSTAGEELAFTLPWCQLLIEAPLEPRGGYAELIVSGTPTREDGAQPPDIDFGHMLTTHVGFGAVPSSLLFNGPGWLRLQATAGDGRIALAHLELKPEQWLYRVPVEFELDGPRGAILIRGSRPDGGRFKWLNCQLFDEQRGIYGRLNELGETDDGWLLTKVAAGHWRLTVGNGTWQGSGDLMLPGVFDVTVRGGETSVVEWNARIGGALELLVDTDGTGAASGNDPLVRAQVLEGPSSRGEDLLLLPAGIHRPMPASADFKPGVLMKVVAPLEPGVYRLRFAAFGFTSHETMIEIISGETARCSSRLTGIR